jgi:hypothetical protein
MTGHGDIPVGIGITSITIIVGWDIIAMCMKLEVE